MLANRRNLRFTLRTLLLVFLLCGCVFAWIRFRTDRWERVTPANEQLAFADDVTPEQADEPESEAPSPRAISDALKTFGLAMHNYHADNNAFPPATNYDANQNKLLSWRVHILPYIDERELYGQFRLNEPWDSPHNKPLIEKMPAIFAAGSGALQKAGKTVFVVPVSEGTVFGSRNPVAIRDLADYLHQQHGR